MIPEKEAEQRAQELIDFYGSGNYTYEVVRMQDGRPGIRVSGFVPSITNMAQENTMNKQERDTHFQGAAKVLWEKMMAIQGGEIGWIDVASDGLDNKWIEKFQQLIAQFLYDFKQHVMNHVDDHELEESYIPDITKLPE